MWLVIRRWFWALFGFQYLGDCQAIVLCGERPVVHNPWSLAQYTRSMLKCDDYLLTLSHVWLLARGTRACLQFVLPQQAAPQRHAPLTIYLLSREGAHVIIFNEATYSAHNARDSSLFGAGYYTWLPKRAGWLPPDIAKRLADQLAGPVCASG